MARFSAILPQSLFKVITKATLQQSTVPCCILVACLQLEIEPAIVEPLTSVHPRSIKTSLPSHLPDVLHVINSPKRFARFWYCKRYKPGNEAIYVHLVIWKLYPKVFRRKLSHSILIGTFFGSVDSFFPRYIYMAYGSIVKVLLHVLPMDNLWISPARTPAFNCVQC